MDGTGNVSIEIFVSFTNVNEENLLVEQLGKIGY
jgi:hypothetical protein